MELLVNDPKHTIALSPYILGEVGRSRSAGDLSDPKDDEVFYTAVAAGADALCTRDRHFPRAQDHGQLLAVLQRNVL